MVSFSDLISGFISTPGKVINYVQENIVRSPKPLKRRRDESTDGAEQSQRVARLKVSLPEPEDKAASRLATLSGNTPYHLADRQLAAGEVVSPPAALLQKQKQQAQAQTQALRQEPWARNSVLKNQPGAVGATPTQPLELWSTIRARRHGPQTGFRPFRKLAMPAKAAESPIMEEHRVRQKILEELRAAGQADEDAEVKTKQAEAKRAALLYKLQQAEFSAGMSTPQPLGRQMEGLDGAQLPRRLNLSASAAPKQAATPAGQQAPVHAQPTPSGAFFANATPLEDQQERAMRQVLQEQEEADRRAQDMARSKAAYEESKARLKQAEEKVRMVCEKAKRVMEGTDPVSSSRRSMQTALAMEIKLAEEERRRLEAQRHHRLLSYAAAQPLPDEAASAPGVQGVLRRKESPGDSASSQQQQKQALRPTAHAQAKAVPKQQEEEAVVLLSSDDEEEEQEEEAHDEEDETEEEEEESALNEELEHVRVDNEMALRQLSKRHRALAAKGLGPGPAEEVVAYHKPSNIEMPRRLLRCLNGLDWLNDEVINIYMGLLQVRDADRRSAGLGPKCHFFNSFFVNKLWKDAGAYCYANVARWTAQKKLEKQGQMSATILEVDSVIMPVHLGNHWTCAVIDLAAQELVYYDSMGGRHMDIMKALRRYVADEYENKTDKCVDTSKWKIRFPTDIPYQTNGSDCGVFALQYAEHVSRNAAFDFDQQDMPYFRLKIAADIMGLNIL